MIKLDEVSKIAEFDTLDEDFEVVPLSIRKLLWDVVQHFIGLGAGVLAIAIISDLNGNVISMVIVIAICIRILQIILGIFQKIWTVVDIENCFIRFDTKGCMIKDHQSRYFEWSEVKNMYIRNRKGKKWLVLRFHPPFDKKRGKVLHLSNLYKPSLKQLLKIMEHWHLEAVTNDEVLTDEGIPGLLPG
jgi:hypothetical protein